MKKALVYMILLFNFCQSLIGQIDCGLNSELAKDSSYVNIYNCYYHKDSIDFPYDPLDARPYPFQQIMTFNNAFLIDEDSYYDFKVLRIKRFKEGYSLLLSTQINNRYALAHVISMNEKFAEGKKIKKGGTYRMKLTRYLNFPCRRNIEYRQGRKIMIGENTVLIEIGYSYLFLTQNLNGRQYIDSSHVWEEDGVDRKRLEDLAYNFVKTVSFKENASNIENYMDTVAIREMFKKNNITSRLPNNFPRHIGKKLKWKKIDYVSPRKHVQSSWKGADTMTFDTLLQHAIEKSCYYPPIDFKKFPDYISKKEDVEVKILHYSDNLYTLGINWEMPESRKMKLYSVIVVRKEGETYKITGINDGACR